MTTTIILSLIACGIGFLLAWLWQSKKNVAEISALRTEKNAEIALLENKKIAETATLETENKNLTEKLQQQKTEINELQTRFTTEFENIANRILKERSAEFSFANQKQIGDILNPLKEKIIIFEKKVDETYNNETREKASLKKELEQIININRQMSDDAQKLTLALKGDKKVQGNWGEMQLEQLLEKSGLEKEVHYSKQVNLMNDEDKKEIPDFVINLPDNKHYIIDSKVSLINYEMYFNAENEEFKQKFLREHIKNIENHINILSAKNYQNLLNSPDFVFMYFALEPALFAALQNDPTLFEKAFQKNIILVSSTTLLASLRTVSFIWKQENQKNHVLEIAKVGGQLYDKFVLFTENLIKIGKSMDDTKKTYTEAMNQLVKENANGTYNAGTIVGMTENLKKLGANTTKSLPQPLINRIES